MSEIIVIDDDDLEEGEIADDIVPEVQIDLPKSKEKRLPRRYVLHDKSFNNRHKSWKSVKNSRLESSQQFSAIHKKKHKSSCRHGLKNKELPVEQLNQSKKIQSAFKNYTSPPRTAPKLKKDSAINQNSENEDSFPKLLLDYKKAKERLNKKSEKVCSKNNNSLHEMKKAMDDEKVDILPTKQSSFDVQLSDITTKEKNRVESEDEDVEELRRLALATCAKRSAGDKISVEIPTEEISNSASCSPSEVQYNSTEMYKVDHDNGSCDNYDVVDMELDDDENFENVSNDNLFIIDKIPSISSEFIPDFSNKAIHQSHSRDLSGAAHSFPVHSELTHLPDNHSQSNDEFEEELLRAELIASLNSFHPKPMSPPKCLNIVQEKVADIVQEKVVDIVQEKVPDIVQEKVPDIVQKKVADIAQEKVPGFVKKQTSVFQKQVIAKPCAIYSRGPLKNTVKEPIKGVIRAKPNFPKLTNNRVITPPPRSINATQERLIITLNNDTSSDESEDEESDKNGATQENDPVSSIEALISNARQKSDINQSVHSNNVSCLSKAQQEEYNSLKKILAEKEPMSVQLPVVKVKNTVDHLHLNFLLERISVAKENLAKEIVMCDSIQKELQKKKEIYMVSKLKVQLLKEQLHAAEKVRAANLESWKQCTAKLDILKKSVLKRESLISLLGTELNSRSSHLVQNAITPPV